MHTGPYINGQWVHPKSDRLVRNINPADFNDVLAEFPSATVADIQQAVEAAQRAFRDWSDDGPNHAPVSVLSRRR